MGLQFNLWGAFREWGENTESEWSEDLDEMHDDKAKLRKAINLGKFYGSLVVDNVVSLQMLKVSIINIPLTEGSGVYQPTICDQDIFGSIFHTHHSAFPG